MTNKIHKQHWRNRYGHKADTKPLTEEEKREAAALKAIGSIILGQMGIGNPNTTEYTEAEYNLMAWKLSLYSQQNREF